MTVPEAAVACSELIKWGANQIEAVLGASAPKQDYHVLIYVVSAVKLNLTTTFTLCYLQ